MFKRSKSKGNDANQLSSQKIFNLSQDAFDNVFEYLSLSELNTLSLTCKRMNQIAGEYFKKNYSALSILRRYNPEGEISINYYHEDQTLGSRLNQFIVYISLSNIDRDPEKCHYLQAHDRELQSIKHFDVRQSELVMGHFEMMKNILSKVESFQIRHSALFDELHGGINKVLSWCKNAKSFHFVNVDRLGYKWLDQTYPKLEHVELIKVDLGPIIGLIPFLDKNPTVRSFSTSVESFWASHYDMLESDEQRLDTLEIKALTPNKGFTEVRFKLPTIQKMNEILLKLYIRGFYKNLHLAEEIIKQGDGGTVARFPGLDSLCVRHFSYELYQFSDLKELIILDCSYANHMEIVANKLVRLERIYLKNVKYTDIEPFIKHSKELRHMKIFPKIRDDFNGGILDLLLLNNEREKLINAQKLIIYVPDKIFVATKWKEPMGQTVFNKVEMKRSDSYAWNKYCGWDYEYGMEEHIAWDIEAE